jgi:hypothetical protein
VWSILFSENIMSSHRVLLLAGVLFVSAGCLLLGFHEAVRAGITRKLMATSGQTALTVTGEHSGAEMEAYAKKLSTPPDYHMPFPLVAEYMTALWKWDKNGAPTLPDFAFTSVDISNISQALPANFTKYSVPDLLRGVWCGPDHPSGLACFVTYDTDKEHMPDLKGLPSQGFRPGHVLFWDTPGNRNTLEFFTRYDLEFEFPKWAENLTNRSVSSIWTYARRPFTQVPFPVAVYEGFPDNPLMLHKMTSLGGRAFWDPNTSEDPAICFCSAHFDGNDVIVRNNFGKELYRVYRVIDQDGQKTKYWPDLQGWAQGRRLVSVNLPLQPDLSCPWNCFWTVTFQCIVFYTPLILICCCCCCGPCVCVAFLIGKRKNKQARTPKRQDFESLDDDDEEEEEVLASEYSH